MSARTYLIFGDIEGKLDVLRVECTKCARKGRYRVRRLIEKYGRRANIMNLTVRPAVGPLGDSLTKPHELGVTEVPGGPKHTSPVRRDGVKNTMPIPSFSIDGVLPPYIGPSGPAGRVEDMSPYVVSAFEVVSTFGGNNERAKILDGWLRHRAQLRSLGFQRGFQWLNGSFLENKEPRDLDVVTFLSRPAMVTVQQLSALVQANRAVFDRVQLKQSCLLDAFFIDLNGSPETIVNVSRYYFGLFSHRRGDELWKGMLQVSLDNPADDGAARAALGAPTSAPVQGTLR